MLASNLVYYKAYVNNNPFAYLAIPLQYIKTLKNSFGKSQKLKGCIISSQSQGIN